jgi:sarcosine oxidase subunit gamma
MNPLRSSPLHTALTARQARFAVVLGMPAAVQVSDSDAAHAATAGVIDVSCLERVGLKGPRAAQWLAERGVPVPPHPNLWCATPRQELVARLGRSEFLIEGGPGGVLVPGLRAELRAGLDGVYPVWRQDCALMLTGSRIPELLVQTCNVDFAAQPVGEPVVTLTQMVGLSVTVLRHSLSGAAAWRVWCDYTAGAYLWETLVGIAEELGGGPAGITAAWPALQAG